MKNNKALIVITVILVMVGLVIGYMIGNSNIFEKNSSIVDDNKNEKTNQKTEDDDENDKSKQKLVLDTVNEKVTGPDASFVCKTLVDVSSVLYDNGDVYVSVGDLVSDSKSYMESLFGQGTYSLAEKTKSIGEIKLNVSNVSKILSFGFGHTCTADVGLVFVKNDGTLAIISYYNILIGKTNVTNILDLKDITSISTTLERNAADVLAIDKNGTKYFLSDYLRTNYKEW